MKKTLVLILGLLITFALFTGCGGDDKKTRESTTTSQIDMQASDVSPVDSSAAASSSEAVDSSAAASSADLSATVPEGDVVDGSLTTKEEPVPLGTWAAITITDGGWPKPAQARIINVSVDQTQTLALIDEYNTNNPNDQVSALKEHAENLDYILVEYEVYFPAGFTDSERIMFSGLILRRENNQTDWIASDGSNYYWMGSEEIIDAPSKEKGYPKNGDTVTCKVVYPMIKGYTDYTLHYKERNVDLSAEIDTYFAIK